VPWGHGRPDPTPTQPRAPDGRFPAFADLANVWLLTGGRIIFPVIGTYAYWLGIRDGQLAAAAAYSLSLVPVLALALVFLFRWFDPPPERAA
jgi:hypothetical protein